MKKCPKCQESYQDDLNFCLQDGSPLVNDFVDEKTEVFPANTDNQNESIVTQQSLKTPLNQVNPPVQIDIPQRTPPNQEPPPISYQPQQKESSAFKFIFLACVFLILGVAGGAGLFWLFNDSNKNTVTSTPTPTPEITFSPTPENTIEVLLPDPTPTPEPEPTPEDDDDFEFEETPTPERKPTPTPKPKGCYLHDGGKGGGEVRIRVECDRYDCTRDSRTIAGRLPNKTPIKKIGGRVNSGGYTWVRISINGKIGWVASTKIRCN